MENVQVRHATSADVQWLVDLADRVQCALTASGSLQQIGPVTEERAFRSISTGSMYILTTMQTTSEQRLGSVQIDPLESRSARFIQWRLQELPTPIWLLHTLMLDPEQQGHGLGLAFLTSIKQMVLATSGTIVLDCWGGNAKLRDFYLRAGFTFHGLFPEKNFAVAVFYCTA